MADKIQILISSILEKSSKQQLEQELKKIEKQLKPIDLKVGINDEAQIKLYKSLQKIEQQQIKMNAAQEKAAIKAITDNEKQLQFEQKLRLQIQKKTDAEKERSVELQKQIQLFQKQMDLQTKGIVGKYGSLVDSNALGAFRNDLNNLSSKTPDVTDKMKNMSLGLKEIELNAKNSAKALKVATQDADSWGNILLKDIQKFGLWFGIGTAFMAVIHKFKDGLFFISEMSRLFVNLQMEMTNTNLVFKDITNTANNYAKAMSSTTENVMKAISVFGTYTSTMDEILKKSQAAIILSNITGQNIEQQADALMGTMAQYKLGAEDAMHIADVITGTARMLQVDYPKAVQDISDGLRSVGAVAKESGASIELMSAILGTVSEKNRRSGIENANALRTIFGRILNVGEEADLESMKKVEKQLDNIGVSIRELGDPNSLRPIGDILKDLSIKWKSLSDVQKQSIAFDAAGMYRKNTFLTLMESYEDVLKNTEAAINSQGVAMQKQEIFEKSLTAATNRLTASWETLYLSTINSDVWKSLINGAAELLNGINSLVKEFGILGVVIPIATAAFALFSKTAFAGIMQAVASSVATLAVNLGLATGAATALGTAMGLIAPVAIAVAVVGLVKVVDILNVSMSELSEQVKKSYSEIESNISRIKELKAEYTSLAQKTSLTREEKLKLISIERELNTKFGDTTSAIDLQNDSLDTNIKKIDLLTKKEAERFKILNAGAYTRAKKLLDENNPYFVGNGNAGVKFDNIAKAISHYEELLKNSTDKTNIVYEFRNEILKKLYKEYDAAIDITTKYDGYEKSLTETTQKSTEASKENSQVYQQATFSLEEYNSKLEQTNKTIDSFQSSAKELSSIFQQLSDGEEISLNSILDLISAYPEYATQIANINNSKEDAISLTETLFDIEKKRTIEKLENDKKELTSEIWKIDSIKKAYEVYKKAFNVESDSIDSLQSENRLKNRFIGGDEETKFINDKINGLNSAIEILRNSNLGDFGSSSKSGSSSSSTPFTPITHYKEQLEDLSSTLSSIDKQIQDTQNSIARAEATGNQSGVLEDTQKLNDLLEQRKQKYHENAEAARALQAELSKAFDAEFSGLSNGKNLLDLTATDIANIKDSLESAISSASTDSDKQYAQNRKAIFDNIISSIDDAKKAEQEYGKLHTETTLLILNNQKKQREAYEQAKEALRKQIYDSLKAQYDEEKNRLEERKKLLQDSMEYQLSEEKRILEESLKELEESIDKRKDLYEEEFEEYKENVEKKYNEDVNSLNRLKELTSRNVDEQKFQTEQKKRQDNLAKLEAKYNKISLDNSGLLAKEKLDLETEMSDLRQEIQDAEKDHSFKLEEDFTDDLIRLKTDEKDRLIKNQEDIKNAKIKDLEYEADANDKTVADYKEAIQALDTTIRLFNEKQKDYFKGSRESIEEELKKVDTEMTSLTEKYDNINEKVAEMMKEPWEELQNFFKEASKQSQDELETLLKKMKEVFDTYQNGTKLPEKPVETPTTGNAGGGSGGLADDMQKSYADEVKRQADNEIQWSRNELDRIDKSDVSAEEKQAAHDYFDAYVGEWIEKARNAGAEGYSTGGVNSVAGTYNLHGTPNSVETIFNASDGKKLFDFVHNLPNNLVDISRMLIPKINIPQLSGVGGGSTQSFDISIDVNLNGVATGSNIDAKKIGRDIGSEFMNTLKWKGSTNILR